MTLLAYLVQLGDPNPPPLIGIEEPENFLHPKLLWELAEKCQVASGRSPLIVTTHSPFFLYGLSPQQVWAMSRDPSRYSAPKRIGDMGGIAAQLQAGASLGQLFVVEELEPWFLGDPPALCAACPGVPPGFAARARFWDPNGARGGTWEALAQLLKAAGHYCGLSHLSKIAVARRVSAL